MNNIKIGMRVIRLALLLLLALPLISIVEVVTVEGQQAYSQTQRVQSIRQKHIKTFEKMQEAFDAEDIPGTLRLLDKLSKEEDLNNIEQAYIRNFRGNIYFQQDNLSAALTQFKGIVQNSEGVPVAFTNQMLYVIAQVLFSQESYREALTYAQRWFKTLPAPTADGYLLIGQAQYQLKDYDGALKNVQNGIDLYTKDGRTPKESWLNLLSNIYRNKNQYRKMEPVLKQLVQHYPKKTYLSTLGGVYNELNNQKDMTAIFLAMYDQGLQTNESELVTVASLMLNNDNPYKAARIMEKGIKDGIIKKNVKNYGLYAQALFFAKEYKDAIGPLREAARLEKTGKYYDQLGQSLIALNSYPEAENALKSAVNKGGLQNTGQTLLSLGLTQFEQKKFKSAKATFNKALKYQKTRKGAQNWIRYLDNELQRLEALKEEIVINTDVEPEDR